MSMNDIITAAANKDAVGFEQYLKEELSKRVSYAIENKINAGRIDESAHIWYDTKHWSDQDKRFDPIDAAVERGVDVAHAATHDQYSHVPDSYIGIPFDQKDLIRHMDKHAILVDIDNERHFIQYKPSKSPIIFGKYELTTIPKMSGDEGKNITHAMAHTRHMELLGVPHIKDDDYGDTVTIQVRNTKNGNTTRHHVYQNSSNEEMIKNKVRGVSIRSIGKPTEHHDLHADVIKHYLEKGLK